MMLPSALKTRNQKRKMGLTGLEPVTLRLSSACSNQLSYRPGRCAAKLSECRLPTFDLVGALRAHLLKSAIANRKSKMNRPPSSRSRGTPARQPQKLKVSPRKFAS